MRGDTDMYSTAVADLSIRRTPKGSNALWTLVYFLPDARRLTRSDLAGIDAGVQASNASLCVTGALAHWDRSFLQVVEGPREAVRAILESVLLPTCAGDRLIQVHEGPCSRRRFEGSPMTIRLLDRPDEVDAVYMAVADLIRAVAQPDVETALTILSVALHPDFGLQSAA